MSGQSGYTIGQEMGKVMFRQYVSKSAKRIAKTSNILCITTLLCAILAILVLDFLDEDTDLLVLLILLGAAVIIILALLMHRIALRIDKAYIQKNAIEDIHDEFYVPEGLSNWEVRVNNDWIYVKKKDMYGRELLSNLVHCAVSYDDSVYVFRLINNQNKYMEFSVKNRDKDALPLLEKLNPHCTGFRNMTSTYTAKNWVCDNQLIRLDRNELAVDTISGPENTLTPCFRIPIQDMVCVTQHHQANYTQTPDNCSLRIYVANGNFYDLKGKSIHHCYEIARVLKDNAPQLRYGIHSNIGLSELMHESF